MGAVASTNIITDGLIICLDPANRRSYPGTGATWTDIVGGNNGTFSGQTFWDSGNSGRMYFDGTDDMVDLDDNASILPDGTNPFTINMWVRPESGHGDYPYLLELAQHDAVDQSFLLLWFKEGSDSIYIGQRTQGKILPNDIADTDLADFYDQWVNICLTYNGGAKGNHTSYRLYFDAVNIALATSGTAGGSGNINRIGYGSSDWKGYMSNISIYNRALSADEVSQNYEALKPRFAPRIAKRGMNLNWDAGDPASYPGGTTWKDTAHGLTTTFHNMDASNFNSSNGGYFDFDGTDEWMTAPYSSLFQGDIADQGTFAAWFNIDEAEAGGSDVPIWCAGRNASLLTWSMAQFNSSKKMHLGAYLGSWMAAATTDTVLSYDTWYYVVFTWDKANTQIKSYINGALDDTDTTSSTSITTSATGELGIGGSLYSVSNGGTPGSFLNGFIGVLQLYNSVLSAAEVMDNYQKTKARFGH